MDGKINPHGCGFNSESDMTAANFFIDKLENLNSIGLLSPVSGPDPDKAASDLPLVWKIFSQTPLTDDDMDQLFESRRETKVVDWLAYPHYKVQQRDTLGKFK